MLIIGVCGKAGSGKDTIADILVKDHGFVKVAFADPLKRICQEVFEFTTEQLWGPSEKRNEADFRYLRSNFMDENGDQVTDYLSPRYALQKLGTEWGRDCYPDIWIEYAMRVAKRLLVKGAPIFYDARFGIRSWRMSDPEEIKGVVISDVRFPNEVAGLKKHGAKVVRVYRDTVKGLAGAAGQHASETLQDGIPDDLFDFILHNNGTLEDLVTVTHGFLSQFQAAERDAGFEDMLKSIPSGATKSESSKPPTYDMVKHRVDSIAAAAADAADLSLRPPPDVVEIPLAPVLAEKDGVQVLPPETAGQAHLRGLLEERQRDVDAGKILPLDESQADIPPFKRKKP